MVSFHHVVIQALKHKQIILPAALLLCPLFILLSPSHFCQTSLSLSLCHTPGSHLLRPYFNPPLYITLSLSFYFSAICSHLPLISSSTVSPPPSQPSYNLYHDSFLLPPFLSLSPHFSVSLSFSSSPAGHFCPVRPLWENNSLWEAGGTTLWGG